MEHTSNGRKWAEYEKETERLREVAREIEKIFRNHPAQITKLRLIPVPTGPRLYQRELSLDLASPHNEVFVGFTVRYPHQTHDCEIVVPIESITYTQESEAVTCVLCLKKCRLSPVDGSLTPGQVEVRGAKAQFADYLIKEEPPERVAVASGIDCGEADNEDQD